MIAMMCGALGTMEMRRSLREPLLGRWMRSPRPPHPPRASSFQKGCKKSLRGRRNPCPKKNKRGLERQGRRSSGVTIHSLKIRLSSEMTIDNKPADASPSRGSGWFRGSGVAIQTLTPGTRPMHSARATRTASLGWHFETFWRDWNAEVFLFGGREKRWQPCRCAP